MDMKHSPVLLVCRFSLACGVFALVALIGLQPRTASAESPAFVRVVHASPDIGTADVFLDGTKILSNFQFGTVTGYATIPPGPHKLKANMVTSIFAVGVVNGTPAIQFVTAQAQGLPGVPPTGSDPNPNAVGGDSNSQPANPWTWLFGVLPLIVIGAAVVTWHQKIKV